MPCCWYGMFRDEVHTLCSSARSYYCWRDGEAEQGTWAEDSRTFGSLNPYHCYLYPRSSSHLFSPRYGVLPPRVRGD